ncbi:MAG: rod shape-determining protein MreD [Sphingomonadales bacterium]|jgi:rod shape-determining protein MreD
MVSSVQELFLFFIKRISPFLLAVFIILLVRIPVGTGVSSHMIPIIGLMYVFYWTINRRRVVPVWSIFLLGLFEDLVAGGPIGVLSILLVVVHSGLDNQRRFFVNRSFIVSWMGFSIICLGISVIYWFLEAFHFGEFLSFLPLIIKVLSTIILYPIFGWVFGKYDRAVIK